MPTANEQLRDATIVQEVLARRAAAGTVALVDKRLVQLERDLERVLLHNNPGSLTGKRQELRLAMLERRVAALHKEAYADCRKITQDDAAGTAYAMSKLMARDLEITMEPAGG